MSQKGRLPPDPPHRDSSSRITTKRGDRYGNYPARFSPAYPLEQGQARRPEKRPSSNARSGLYGYDSSSPSARASSHYSTSRWIASSALVTSCAYASGMLRTATKSPTGRLSCSRRLGARCNLRSRDRLASPSQRGSSAQVGDRRITFSQVACRHLRTCRRGNTRGLCAIGSGISD